MNGFKKTLVGMVAGALGFVAQGCEMEELQHLPGGRFSLMVERPFIAKKKIFNYSPAQDGGKPACAAYTTLEIGGEEYLMIVSNECDKTIAKVELSSIKNSHYCVYVTDPETKRLELFSKEGVPPMDGISLAKHAHELLNTFYDGKDIERIIGEYSK